MRKRRDKRAASIQAMLGKRFELESDCMRFRFKIVGYTAHDTFEILENTDRRWIPAEMLLQAKRVNILREVADAPYERRTPGAPVAAPRRT